MLNTPTHLTNSSLSCIDLIFASNMSYLITGIEQSIYDDFARNIIYGKMNFDILLPQPLL